MRKRNKVQVNPRGWPRSTPGVERVGLALNAKRYTLYASKGFTLIELMVASTILVLIGMAVLTTFASGLHVYERVQSYGGVQAEVLLALEEMQHDISNTFQLSEIPFVGEPKMVAVPAVIETVETLGEEESFTSTVGQVVYTLGGDDEKKVLMRDEWDYARALSKDEVDSDESGFLAFVKDLKFRYYYYDAENKQYAWKDDWTEEDEGLPTAVGITLTFEDRGRDIELNRTVFIPSVDIAVAQEEEEEDEAEDGEEGEEGGGPQDL